MVCFAGDGDNIKASKQTPLNSSKEHGVVFRTAVDLLLEIPVCLQHVLQRCKFFVVEFHGCGVQRINGLRLLLKEQSAARVLIVLRRGFYRWIKRLPFLVNEQFVVVDQADKLLTIQAPECFTWRQALLENGCSCTDWCTIRRAEKISPPLPSPFILKNCCDIQVPLGINSKVFDEDNVMHSLIEC